MKNQNTDDPLAPVENTIGLCGGLHTATIATINLEAYKKFYVEALEMDLVGPIPVSEDQKKQQRKLWDFPSDLDWETYLLHRPGVPGLIQIRLLVLNKETPSIHKSHDSRELGPFSLGFPNAAQDQLDRELRERGFSAMAPIQEGTVERPDGSSYRYIETIYKAPDFLHAVGIERMDGMPQLAPVDPKTKMGGPGYSAMVLKDSDEMLEFLEKVLDLELRADRIWETSPGSALGIEPGVSFRFSLVYAKGNSHNHLLFLDYKDKQFIPLNVAPRIPNRGLGMWTFETKNMDTFRKRTEEYNTHIVQNLTDYEDPVLGKIKVISLLAPNGFLIEVFEKQ